MNPLAMLRLRSASLPVKLGLVGVVLGVALSWTGWSLYRSQSEVIDYSVRERQGVVTHRAMRALVRDLQTHRGAVSLGAASEAAVKARGELEASVAAVDKSMREQDAPASIADEWKRRKAAWDDLKLQVATIKPAEAVARHTKLIGELLDLMDDTARDFGITLDPDADSYYLMNANVVLEPAATASLGSMRSAGLLVLKGEATPEQRTRFVASYYAANENIKLMGASLRESAKANADVAGRIGIIDEEAKVATAAFLAEAYKIVLNEDKADVDKAAYSKLGGAATAARFKLYDESTKMLQSLIDKRIESRTAARTTNFAIAAGLATLAFLLAVSVVIDTIRRVRMAQRFADDVANGRLDGKVDADGRDEMSGLLAGLGRMRDQIAGQMERDRAQLAETLKVRNALDVCATAVMIADDTGHVRYVNAELGRMMNDAQADLRVAVPGFDAGRVLGASLDQFRATELLRAETIATLNDTQRREAKLGPRTFLVAATPIRDPDGKRLGTVVEWRDRTQEVASEEELGRVIAGAANGDFSPRVSLDGKSGYYRQFSSRTNELLDSVSNGLGELRVVLDALARGDLTQRMADTHKGVFGELAESANATMSRLAELVGEIETTSSAIDSASREIAQGNADLSTRTEQQASALEETASSMEELTSTVRQNAENARQANTLAGDASKIAKVGGDTVGSAVGTMREIAESSRRIQDIIAVIDGIAFQTNILALNAAVEAARAGEQGRGFAVVATEVRNLAQRSSSAAKEIKELITNSVQRVEAGVSQVNDAGARMAEIVTAIQRVTDIMGEITSASAEQSSGIEQVSTAVGSMDQMTQQNAALVEQAAAAAESLQDQARHLVETVGVFRVDATSVMAKPVARPGASTSMPAAAPSASSAVGTASGADGGWDGVTERRGPDRAKNVARMKAPAATASAPASGGQKFESRKVADAGDWTEF